jgi:hypothetical protein
MKRIFLLAAGFAALLATPAMADTSACLRIGQIYNWTVQGRQTLIVEDNFHHKFKVDLLGYCPDLNFKERIGFKSLGAMALSCLSPGDDVVVREFGTGGQNCPIRAVSEYTPAMEKADKDAAAAKAAGDTH